MSEIKEFKTESKRLLDLMINSIYTNQEIFIRELVSNASDAIDKYHYLSLTDDKLAKRNNYEINIELNKDARTIKITDNGIGMTYDEINDNLGTIAKSGSLEFLKKMEKANEEGKNNVDIIGQFGVGFYSAFMVAKLVTVDTKSPYSDKAYRFTSSGTDTYEVEEINKTTDGSEITLYLRSSTDDNDYDKYLDEYFIKSLIKKYSDYIRYPITMYVTREVPKLDEEGKEIEGEYDEIKELETLNSMIPLWKKAKNEITDEELNKFYQQKYYDYQDPSMHLLFNIEGNINYTALLFIPKEAPYDLYTKEYESGLQLYTKGVFIMDKCKELIPYYLRFVKGLVDSSDLSLNISREMLQQNKVLQKMGKNIEKKIIGKLEDLMKDDFDKYVDFFKNFGNNIKFGAYENYGSRKELLQDLLIYETVNTDNYVSLSKYLENKPENQKYIYYVSSKSKESVIAMPQMDLIKKNGFDVLVLKDDVDEFLFKIMGKYNDVEFKSINQGDLSELLTDEEKKELDDKKNQNKDFLDALKDSLKDKVKDVVLSKRLTTSAVCLVSGDGISFEMEKVIANMPGDEKISADKILEINPNHPLFKAIEKIYRENPQELNLYSSLLYNQALLIEGFKIDDPISFSNTMCDLMIKSIK